MMHRPLLATMFLFAAVTSCGCRSEDAAADRRAADAERAAAEPPAQPAVEPPATPGSPAVGTSSEPAPVRARPKPKPPDGAAAEKQRAAAEKAHLERQLEEQRAANDARAQETARLQKQLDQLKPREITVPEGTLVVVRTATELSTARLSDGSTFEAVLEQPLVSGDTVVAKPGTPVTGVVVSSDRGGKVKGTASLTVGIRSIVGVNGRVIPVRTDSYSVEAKSTKGRDAARTGIATGVGAAIGAIAGGGKGAAIGAGTGAAAGVGTNMATRGEAAVIPAETLIELRLTAPVTVVLQP